MFIASCSCFLGFLSFLGGFLLCSFLILRSGSSFSFLCGLLCVFTLPLRTFFVELSQLIDFLVNVLNGGGSDLGLVIEVVLDNVIFYFPMAVIHEQAESIVACLSALSNVGSEVAAQRAG